MRRLLQTPGEVQGVGANTSPTAAAAAPVAAAVAPKAAEVAATTSVKAAPALPQAAVAQPMGETLLKLNSVDLDTGKATGPGEYGLADKTYADLLLRLAKEPPTAANAAARHDVLLYFGPDQAAKNRLRGMRSSGQRCRRRWLGCRLLRLTRRNPPACNRPRRRYTAGIMWTRMWPCVLVLLAVTAGAQDHVLSAPDDFLLPVVVPGRIADADLQPALRRFNGQHSLDGVRRPGLVNQMLPPSVAWHSHTYGDPVVAEGVVLHSDAYLAPDLTGVVTVLTVEPTAMLQVPETLRPVVPLRPPYRRRGDPPGPPAPPPPPAATLLRFVLAGGVVYSDDNNGLAVQQTGVNYPAAGDTLVFFGETMPSEDGNGRSTAVLMLAAACAPRAQSCVSIDGNQTTSDTLTSHLPGGMTMVQAFNLDGAAIANATAEGVRGLGRSIEARYDLRVGDLRRQQGLELPMSAAYSPARGTTLLVRAHVFSTDATLTTGGGGLVSHALITVDRVVVSAPAVGHPHTLEVYDRGGFLRMDDETVKPALLPTQLPLVAGGEYFLTLGLTDDNRWELRESWRIVGDEVFAMNRPRTQIRDRSHEGYVASTDEFLRAASVGSEAAK